MIVHYFLCLLFISLAIQEGLSYQLNCTYFRGPTEEYRKHHKNNRCAQNGYCFRVINSPNSYNIPEIDIGCTEYKDYCDLEREKMSSDKKRHLISCATCNTNNCNEADKHSVPQNLLFFAIFAAFKNSFN